MRTTNIRFQELFHCPWKNLVFFPINIKRCRLVVFKRVEYSILSFRIDNFNGADSDSWFSHIAVEVPGEGGSSEWLEAVSDEDYAKLNYEVFR